MLTVDIDYDSLHLDINYKNKTVIFNGKLLNEFKF